MEQKEVEVVVGYRDIPGKRIHGSIAADSLKPAYEAAGLPDYGAHVVDDHGIEHHRPDETLAMVLAELQFLRKRVAMLEKTA